jgi:hypothetical protein
MQLQTKRSVRVVIDSGEATTVYNLGAGTVYYGKTADVTTSSYDGTIVSGDVKTFSASQYLTTDVDGTSVTWGEPTRPTHVVSSPDLTSAEFRRLASLSVMGAAPTVSDIGNAGDYGGSQLYYDGDNATLALDGQPITSGSGHWVGYKLDQAGVVTHDPSACIRTRFGHFNDTLEFRMWAATGTTPTWRLAVDGQFTSATPTTITADNNNHTIKVDFGSKADREVYLETTGYFMGVYTPITAPLRPARQVCSSRVAIVGDSYAAGAAGTARYQGYFYTLARRFGWANVLNLGVGGTGVVATNGGTSLAYGDPLRMAQLAAYRPTHVLVQNSGPNDKLLTASYATAAAAFYSDLADLIDPVNVVVLGPLFTRAYESNMTTLAALARTAAESRGFTYVSASTWFTGTGNAGATTGDGSGDYTHNADDVHPTTLGADIIAARAIPYISSAWGMTAA